MSDSQSLFGATAKTAVYINREFPELPNEAELLKGLRLKLGPHANEAVLVDHIRSSRGKLHWAVNKYFREALTAPAVPGAQLDYEYKSTACTSAKQPATDTAGSSSSSAYVDVGAAEEGATSLDAFPVSVIEEICKHLDVHSLCQLAQVSRTCRKAAASDGPWARLFNLRWGSHVFPIPPPTTATTASTLRQQNPHIRHTAHGTQPAPQYSHTHHTAAAGAGTAAGAAPSSSTAAAAASTRALSAYPQLSSPDAAPPHASSSRAFPPTPALQRTPVSLTSTHLPTNHNHMQPPLASLLHSTTSSIPPLSRSPPSPSPPVPHSCPHSSTSLPSSQYSDSNLSLPCPSQAHGTDAPSARAPLPSSSAPLPAAPAPKPSPSSWQQRYHCQFEYEATMSCPCCSGQRIVPIVYGFPSTQLLQGVQQGRLVLGGDHLIEDCHVWACTACNASYRYFPFQNVELWVKERQHEGGRASAEGHRAYTYEL